jgi:hypothetical protein
MDYNGHLANKAYLDLPAMNCLPRTEEYEDLASSMRKPPGE